MNLREKWADHAIRRRLWYALLPLADGLLLLRYLVQEEKTAMLAWQPWLFAALWILTVAGAVPMLRFPKYSGYGLMLFQPLLLCYLVERLTQDPGKLGIAVFLLNALFYWLLELVLFGLTRRTAAATVGTTVFVMILGMVNYYTLLYRGVPLFPWDIASAGTAASVAGNYRYEFNWTILLVLASFLLLILIGFRSHEKLPPAVRLWQSGIGALAAVGLLFGYGAYLQTDDATERFQLNIYLFTPRTMYHTNGLTVAFFRNFQYLRIHRPAGYNEETLRAAMEEYEALAAVQETSDVLPNILVIMNEAFSDPSILQPFTTNVDYMPCLRMLREQNALLYGQLYVSVLGGNTANTEFEFLTGMSMAFLPSGSVPYQQYLDHPVESLVSQLRRLGYSTASIHPYLATGWERDQVYPLLGFERSLFRSDFSGAEVLRSYVTDRATYAKMKQLLTEKQPGQPLFVFDVTMQNHSGYANSYANFHPDVTVQGEGNSKRLSHYLSLLKVSDEALAELISFVSTEIEEPTVILFFGDHQPADIVVQSLYTAAGADINDLTDQQRSQRYVTPFYLWSNYDLPTGDAGSLSANYLASFLLRTLGLPLTAQQLYQQELIQKYPVLTANFFLDSSGAFYLVWNQTADDAIWNRLAQLQYQRLFSSVS